MYVIKPEVADLSARSWTFETQKTIHGGNRIRDGDHIFVFASENEGGPGLIASGVVTSAIAIPKEVGVERQTPRVSITVTRTGRAKRAMRRSEFYRQATNKIGGVSKKAAAFLQSFM